MRFALDTNILVYAENFQAKDRYEPSLNLLATIDVSQTCIPVQVLGELHRVLIGRAGLLSKEALERVTTYSDAFHCPASTWSTLVAAMELHRMHKVPTWDALIFCVAAEQGCRILFSEDFQEGFSWFGVTVVNPYSKKHTPKIKALLPPSILDL